MIINLLITGRKILEENSFDFKRFFMLLADRDYEVNKICYKEAADPYDRISDGEEESLTVVIGEDETVAADADESRGGYVKKDNDYFVFMPVFDENVVRNVIIPLLNSRTKNGYNAVVFKTFGQSADELRERLSGCLKNRNRIVFNFYQDGMKCDVRVKYSKSTPSTAVTEMIDRVNEALSDCVYALKDIPLAKNVARQLMASGKRLSAAESFTGGGLAAALIASPGMSKVLIESVVCYSDEAKIERLGVPANVIAKSGAVSADTAFEMANGLLSNPHCDVAVATTGNAGPTAERDGRVGLFYVAVGDRSAIHVFEQLYEVKNADKKSVDDIRREITKAGIETALYELGRYLKS